MNRDYRFLIGQRFSVAGAVYVVRDLTWVDDRTYVDAITSEEAIAADQLREVTDEREEPPAQTFNLSDVIQWLLVDEEIELFNPNYLAAR